MTGTSGAGIVRGVSAMTTPHAGPRLHRDYCRWRARQIAYGWWRPWADATPVSGHLRMLRAGGASYQEIARAAGVSAMTVYRLLHGEPSKRQGVTGRIRAAPAERLLAITSAMLDEVATRRDATGTRRRLQALIAMGHPAASLARHLGLTPRTVSGIVRGTTVTVTPATYAAIRKLYDRIWDMPPPERTPAERRAAAAARARAAGNGWPTPMGLDDDHIDDPAYRPRTRWRAATSTAVTPPACARKPTPGPPPSPAQRHGGSIMTTRACRPRPAQPAVMYKQRQAGKSVHSRWRARPQRRTWLPHSPHPTRAGAPA